MSRKGQGCFCAETKRAAVTHSRRHTRYVLGAGGKEGERGNNKAPLLDYVRRSTTLFSRPPGPLCPCPMSRAAAGNPPPPKRMPPEFSRRKTLSPKIRIPESSKKRRTAEKPRRPSRKGRKSVERECVVCSKTSISGGRSRSTRTAAAQTVSKPCNGNPNAVKKPLLSPINLVLIGGVPSRRTPTPHTSCLPSDAAIYSAPPSVLPDDGGKTASAAATSAAASADTASASAP